MSSPTADFFNEIGRRRTGDVPTKFHGTIRFDLLRDGRTEHWYLAIDEGTVTVSREHSEATSTIQTDEELFDLMVTGRRGVKAALLRGALTVEGDISLLTAFRDLLPGPPVAHDPGVRALARRPADRERRPADRERRPADRERRPADRERP
jgi:hypothetical protein